MAGILGISSWDPTTATLLNDLISDPDRFTLLGVERRITATITQQHQRIAEVYNSEYRKTRSNRRRKASRRYDAIA